LKRRRHGVENAPYDQDAEISTTEFELKAINSPAPEVSRVRVIGPSAVRGKKEGSTWAKNAVGFTQVPVGIIYVLEDLGR